MDFVVNSFNLSKGKPWISVFSNEIISFVKEFWGRMNSWNLSIIFPVLKSIFTQPISIGKSPIVVSKSSENINFGIFCFFFCESFGGSSTLGFSTLIFSTFFFSTLVFSISIFFSIFGLISWKFWPWNLKLYNFLSILSDVINSNCKFVNLSVNLHKFEPEVPSVLYSKINGFPRTKDFKDEKGDINFLLWSSFIHKKLFPKSW